MPEVTDCHRSNQCCFSTCWNPWLIPNNGWKWWLAYRDAMSFRASHYFVSFMSEASVIAAGFGAHCMGTHILWHYTVTQPHNVEVRGQWTAE